ncbi:MAG: hypothetical protein EOM18_12615 [Clostridia bacterium]|uniref:Uncharacterized protein n=1 Tax=Hespellia stercorisuis DSM 15480 TaxID=1121950 RepID=A0A1M6UVD2_9FIRM|nr:hypothetical protein [Hespellia stercorisuis]NCC44388.1 hypothetical protein [Clostridia bacterium]SHK73158.1 hypothetical protein SAMN02745243_03617 [Hespellia stercorisuis DSM 15480]
MNNPRTIEEVVTFVLEKSTDARNDDMKLYLLVCDEVNSIVGSKNIGNIPFAVIMNNYKELNLPHFESVRRSRAKIQSKHPELAGDPECRKSRKQLEGLYKTYAKS